MADDYDFDDAMADGEFGDGKAANTGAGEAIIAKHLTKEQKAARLAAKYQGGPRFLSLAWFKAARPAPLAHIKRNFASIFTTTAIGTAGAAVGTYTLSKALGTAPDPLAVAKTATLAYAGYRVLDGGFARAGFYYGHLRNAMLRDRFQEVKTEPAGRWFGRATWAAATVAGGLLGHAYYNGIANATIQLPLTITQGVPSSIVDTFTNLSNTSFDANWEIEDQAACLQQAIINPAHICNDGPGSEAFNVVSANGSTTVTIDEEALRANEGAELGWTGRRFGVNPAFNTDWIPDRSVVNGWINERLGL
ncbi:MAG TPA: hypothetical protein EYG18_03650 [Micavibrio sp.]|nr:hypothetical protein [Micavibrio sp.]HIL28344.1 hypothetical protein [Micavibrio sp.]